ncbi:MAG TPA: YbaK/EbsC family protein [Pirellulaceae bacterium]|nr:YbaK/EbsC family protein [Pirellulaceae bacterium]
MSVLDRLIEKLDAGQIPYDVSHHEPVFTSEEAARIRGTTLASGAKALICKADRRFVLIVLPADKRLASKQVRKSESIRKLRFASREEVVELTGLQPGSIPPFGSLFDLPTWCDEDLALQPTINFNAGDHTVSISMQYTDFAAFEQPLSGQFAE